MQPGQYRRTAFQPVFFDDFPAVVIGHHRFPGPTADNPIPPEFGGKGGQVNGNQVFWRTQDRDGEKGSLYRAGDEIRFVVPGKQRFSVTDPALGPVDPVIGSYKCIQIALARVGFQEGDECFKSRDQVFCAVLVRSIAKHSFAGLLSKVDQALG